MYCFAKSSIEDMHVEDLRLAIFNYICSTKDKKEFMLKLKNTNEQQNSKNKEKDIIEFLAKFDIVVKQIFAQNHNLKFHRQLASKLLIDKKAFVCFCSEEEIKHKKEQAKQSNSSYSYDGTCEKMSNDEVLGCEKPFVVRTKRPKQTISFTDNIKGKISFSPDEIDDFIIVKKDKTPSFDFACAIDDMFQDTSFIIDQENNEINTSRQNLIRQYLGYEKPISYAHLPKIANKDDIASIKSMLDDGFMPEAIANYLILLGNKTPKEIFTLQEAIHWFDITKISNKPINFDIRELKKINQEHIKLASDLRLNELLGLEKSYSNLIRFYANKISLLTKIKEKIEKIYSKKIAPKEFDKEFKIIKEAIKNLTIEFETFDEFKDKLMQITKLTGESFLIPLTVLLTSETQNSELNELYPLIKKDLKKITQ
ncbi:glutamate--tRNA ligase [Campylobacter pinnipediorum subsp. caledonicus]|uniref:glutamate--tRNA ligase n=1 Tax=Campylobacter pinnipediorum TaxID=1965231 RepID=UPI0009959F55|nr:glutamate--tRNA ligase family protein [Campylobacter pinnipediorum]OPA71529.1 glutamate--tRNA ligase [Campylobacter pinnipediorum subsp. caledonicus]